MANRIKYFVITLALLVVGLSYSQLETKEEVQRQEIDFNFGWKFALSNDNQAHNVDYEDSQWRDIRLPHDWSIEADYGQTDRAGATAYLPGRTAWYRKEFEPTNVNAKNQIFKYRRPNKRISCIGGSFDESKNDSVNIQIK